MYQSPKMEKVFKKYCQSDNSDSNNKNNNKNENNNDRDNKDKNDKKIADFVTIHIAEAHATDEWFLFEYCDIPQHKTMIDRCHATYKYIQMSDTKAYVVMDLLPDIAKKCEKEQRNCETAYSANPERLYIILDGKIVYKGGIGPHGYAPREIDQWMQNFIKNKQKPKP